MQPGHYSETSVKLQIVVPFAYLCTGCNNSCTTL